MKKRLFKLFALLLLSSFALASCGKTETDCLSVMTELSLKLSIDAPIFSPTKKEGEAGFCAEGFLAELYGIDEGAVVDFAIIFCSTLDSYGEAAVMLCHTEYDAVLCVEAQRARLREVLTSGGELDLTAARNAEIKRVGRWVVMCALGDNARAMRLIESRI